MNRVEHMKQEFNNWLLKEYGAENNSTWSPYYKVPMYSPMFRSAKETETAYCRMLSVYDYMVQEKPDYLTKLNFLETLVKERSKELAKAAEDLQNCMEGAECWKNVAKDALRSIIIQNIETLNTSINFLESKIAAMNATRSENLNNWGDKLRASLNG